MTTITPNVPLPEHFADAYRAVEYWRHNPRFHGEAVAHLERLHAVAYEVERMGAGRWEVTRVLDDGTRHSQILDTWVSEPELVAQVAITAGNWKEAECD